MGKCSDEEVAWQGLGEKAGTLILGGNVPDNDVTGFNGGQDKADSNTNMGESASNDAASERGSNRHVVLIDSSRPLESEHVAEERNGEVDGDNATSTETEGGELAF